MLREVWLKRQGHLVHCSHGQMVESEQEVRDIKTRGPFSRPLLGRLQFLMFPKLFQRVPQSGNKNLNGWAHVGHFSLKPQHLPAMLPLGLGPFLDGQCVCANFQSPHNL